MQNIILASVASLITAFLITPLIIKLAFSINAIDQPDNRKVHQIGMPRIGGLAIILSVITGFLLSDLSYKNISAITIAGFLIALLGFFDDLYNVSPKMKLLIQILASIIVTLSGLTIEILHIPFIGVVNIGIMEYPLTILWIVAITNIINIIDGLDGLAAGVSGIVISTIAFMAFYNNNQLIFTLSLILIGSILGFLFYNFYPAKIFMGDVGSLFLGYCISILSLLGLYKSVTLFSISIPIIILGVPIADTFFAIIRRKINNKSIVEADKGHLHHRILHLGISHRLTVLIIYGISICFSLIAVYFYSATFWESVTVALIILVILMIAAELLNLTGNKFKPLLSLYWKLINTARIIKRQKKKR
jgi:UDP-GlcNAc:undecaprenyl-phosphate/decaprenyl-phosphate GlcNAc-1-phosphate transferase